MEEDDIPTFAARIKAKYPDYASVDDYELVEKVVRKHPVYASQVKLPEGFGLLYTSSGYGKIDSIYEEMGRKYNVDPNLLLEQGRQETSFNPDVFYGKRASSAGAVGAGQFMPGTAPKYGVTDRTDPIQSIEGQAKYMRKLLDDFDNDESLALAGYNAGEYRKALTKDRRVPNIPETQHYVKTIKEKLDEARSKSKRLRDFIQQSPSVQAPTPTTQPTTQPTPEAPSAFEAQLTVARDPKNMARSGVFFPNDGTNAALKYANGLDGNWALFPDKKHNGTHLINLTKAKKLKLRTPKEIQEFIDKNPNAFKTLGIAVEDVGNDTQGVAITAENNGVERASAVVRSPETAVEQINAYQKQFPNADISVTSTDDVVRQREEVDRLAPTSPTGEADDPDEMGRLQKRFESERRADPTLTVERFNNKLKLENEELIAKSKQEWLLKNPAFAKFALDSKLDPFDQKSIEAYNANQRSLKGQRVTKPAGQKAVQQLATKAKTKDEIVQAGAIPQIVPNQNLESGVLKTANGSTIKRVTDDPTYGVAPPDGFERYVDANNQTYLVNELDGTVQDESLAAVADTFQVKKVPINMRNIVPVEEAKKRLAIQVADQIGAKYDLDKNDVYAWILKKGIVDVGTDKDASENNLYQTVQDTRNAATQNNKTSIGSSDVRTDGLDSTYSLTGRQLQSLLSEVPAQTSAKEQAALQRIAQGAISPDPTKAELEGLGVNLDRLKRNPKFYAAAEKGKQAQLNIERIADDLKQSGDFDDYTAPIKARANLGIIGQGVAQAEIDAYKKTLADKTSANRFFLDETPQGVSGVNGRSVAMAGGMIPESQSQRQSRMNAWIQRQLKDDLEKNGSFVKYQENLAKAEAEEQERQKRIANDPVWQKVLKGTQGYLLGVPKSVIKGGASVLQGAPIWTKPIANYIDSLFGTKSGSINENAIFKLGQAIKDAADTALPTDKDYDKSFLAGTVPQALGSSLAFLPAALGGPLGIALFSTLQMTGDSYEDALQGKAKEPDAQQYARLNGGLLGWTELLGFGNAFQRLVKGSAKTTWKKLALEALKEAGEEVFTNEGPQSIGSNVLAKLTYDPNRKWDKDLMDSLQAAGVTAPLASVLISGLLHVKHAKAIKRIAQNDLINGGPSVRDFGDETGFYVFGKSVPETDDLKPLFDKHREIQAKIAEELDAYQKVQKRWADLPKTVTLDGTQVASANRQAKYLGYAQEIQQNILALAKEQSDVSKQIVEQSGVPSPTLLDQKNESEDAQSVITSEDLATEAPKVEPPKKDKADATNVKMDFEAPVETKVAQTDTSIKDNDQIKAQERELLKAELNNEKLIPDTIAAIKKEIQSLRDENGEIADIKTFKQLNDLLSNLESSVTVDPFGRPLKEIKRVPKSARTIVNNQREYRRGENDKDLSNTIDKILEVAGRITEAPKTKENIEVSSQPASLETQTLVQDQTVESTVVPKTKKTVTKPVTDEVVETTTEEVIEPPKKDIAKKFSNKPLEEVKAEGEVKYDGVDDFFVDENTEKPKVNEFKVEPFKGKEVSDPITLESIGKEVAQYPNVDEAFKAFQERRDIPPDVAQAFADKYKEGNTPKQAFEKFYNEVTQPDAVDAPSDSVEVGKGEAPAQLSTKEQAKALRDLGYTLPVQRTLSDVQKADIIAKSIKKQDYVATQADVEATPSNRDADIASGSVEAKDIAVPAKGTTVYSKGGVEGEVLKVDGDKVVVQWTNKDGEMTGDPVSVDVNNVFTEAPSTSPKTKSETQTDLPVTGETQTKGAVKVGDTVENLIGGWKGTIAKNADGDLVVKRGKEVWGDYSPANYVPVESDAKSSDNPLRSIFPNAHPDEIAAVEAAGVEVGNNFDPAEDSILRSINASVEGNGRDTTNVNALAKEARKFATADEFASAQWKKHTAYKDGHRAPSRDERTFDERRDQGGDFSLLEVADGKHNQADDYFDPRVGARYYGYDNLAGHQSYTAISNIIRAVKSGNVEGKTVTTYRAVPKGVKPESLRDGDWVTFSKQYAIDHGEHRFGENEYRIIEQEVNPADVWWDNNDINEWGYDSGYAWNKSVAFWNAVNNNTPLFKIRSSEDVDALYNVLPYIQNTGDLLEYANGGTITDGELELSPYDAEVTRRLLAEVQKGADVPASEGAVYNASTLNKMAKVAEAKSAEMTEMGYPSTYTDNLDNLAKNLRTIASNAKHGILYTFDESLPEERFHLEDLSAGRTSKEAIEQMKQSPLWDASEKFNRDYGKLSDRDKASEIVAKLATGQEKAYGWDKIDNFEAERAKLFDTWIDGVIAQNNITNIEAFNKEFPRLGAVYAEAKTNKDRTGKEGVNGNAGVQGGTSEGTNETRGQSEEGDGVQDRAVQEEGEVKFTPGGKEKESEAPKTLQKRGFPVKERIYTSTTNAERTEFANKQLDKGVDEAKKWAESQLDDENYNAGATGVVGINVLIQLGKEKRMDEFNKFADKLMPAYTDAGQMVQSLAIVSIFSPETAPVYLAKMAKKNGKTVTQEQLDKATDIAERMSESSQAMGVTEAAYEAEKQFNELLKNEIDELEKALDIARSEGEELAKKNKELRTQLAGKGRKIASLERKLEGSLPKTRLAGEVAKKVKEIDARKDDILKRIAAKFGENAVLRMIAGGDNILRSSNPPIDQDVKDWATWYLGNNIGKITVRQFKDALNTLTNGAFSADELARIHADAVNELRVKHAPMDAEKRVATALRNSHYREADRLNEKPYDVFGQDVPKPARRFANAVVTHGIRNGFTPQEIWLTIARKAHPKVSDALKAFRAEFPEVTREEERQVIKRSQTLTNDVKAELESATIQKKSEDRLSQEDIDLIKNERSALRNAQMKISSEANTFYNSLVKSKTQVIIETLVNARRANLLTAVKSHFVNIIGNLGFGISEELSRVPSTMLDTLAGVFTGERTTTFAPKGIIAGFKSLIEQDETLANAKWDTPDGRNSGIQAALHVLKYGGSLEDLERLQHAESALSATFKGRIPKWIDNYVNATFRALGAEDALFKVYAFRRHIEEQARAIALTEHKTDKSVNVKERTAELVANPTNVMQVLADQYAHFMTFQNDNIISTKIAGIKRSIGYGGKAAIETIMPYDRTPTNIVLRTLEYTPAGYAIGGAKFIIGKRRGISSQFRNDMTGAAITDVAQDFASLPDTEKRQLVEAMLNRVYSRSQQEQFAKTMGRASVGTGLFTLGFVLAAAGLMAGSMSPDDDDRKETSEFFRRMQLGVDNGSLAIPGVGRITLPKSPATVAMTAGATLYEQMIMSKNSPTKAAIDASNEAFWDLASEQPLINSTTNLMRTFGKGKFGEFTGNLLSGFVPASAMVRSISEVGDAKARTGSGYKKGEKIVTFEDSMRQQQRGFKNSFLRGIPVARNYFVDESTAAVSDAERGGVARRFIRQIDPFNFRSKKDKYVPPKAR